MSQIKTAYTPSFATALYRGVQSTDIGFVTESFVSRILPPDDLPLIKPLAAAINLAEPGTGVRFAKALTSANEAVFSQNQHDYLRAQVAMNIALAQLSEESLESAVGILRGIHPASLVGMFKTSEEVIQGAKDILARKSEQEQAKNNGIPMRFPPSPRTWTTADELLWIMNSHKPSWKYAARNFGGGAPNRYFFSKAVQRVLKEDSRFEAAMGEWKSMEIMAELVNHTWKEHYIVRRYNRDQTPLAFALINGALLMYCNELLTGDDVDNFQEEAASLEIAEFPITRASDHPIVNILRVSDILEQYRFKEAWPDLPKERLFTDDSIQPSGYFPEWVSTHKSRHARSEHPTSHPA